MSDSPLDQLWKEYGELFKSFDDISLARWLAQTLGQLRGFVWRLSHPLMGSYRLGAQEAHHRQIWLKRLASTPPEYPEAGCCRAALLPLVTRDVIESGLICQHCGDTAVPFDEIPAECRDGLREWAMDYAPVHAVAHWDDEERREKGNYNDQFEDAAQKAAKLLTILGSRLAPKLLEHYPAVVWEDQDECLEVRPEDVEL